MWVRTSEAERAEGHADGHQPARAELGDQPAGERRDEDHRHGDRQHLRPQSDRRVAADVLQVLGLEVDHRPPGADQAEGGGAGAEVGAVAEEVELDDRRPHAVLDRPEGERSEASPSTASATSPRRPRLPTGPAPGPPR